MDANSRRSSEMKTKRVTMRQREDVVKSQKSKDIKQRQMSLTMSQLKTFVGLKKQWAS